MVPFGDGKRALGKALSNVRFGSKRTSGGYLVHVHFSPDIAFRHVRLAKKVTKYATTHDPLFNYVKPG